MCLLPPRETMSFFDPDAPSRINELALYASLVATGVIALNVFVVKIGRRLMTGRHRPGDGGPSRSTGLGAAEK